MLEQLFSQNQIILGEIPIFSTISTPSGPPARVPSVRFYLGGRKLLVVKFKQMVPIGSESFRRISVCRRAPNVRSVPLERRNPTQKTLSRTSKPDRALSANFTLSGRTTTKDQPKNRECGDGDIHHGVENSVRKHGNQPLPSLISLVVNPLPKI
jgi:hypothetical protein